MRRESIVKFFEHIAAWEVSHGVQDAFGFKNILLSQGMSYVLCLSELHIDFDSVPSMTALRRLCYGNCGTT